MATVPVSSAASPLPLQIDALVQQLKQDPKNVFIEIEGHTEHAHR